MKKSALCCEGMRPQYSSYPQERGRGGIFRLRHMPGNIARFTPSVWRGSLPRSAAGVLNFPMGGTAAAAA